MNNLLARRMKQRIDKMPEHGATGFGRGKFNGDFENLRPGEVVNRHGHIISPVPDWLGLRYFAVGRQSDNA